MTVSTPVQPDFNTQDAATYKAYIDAAFAAAWRAAMAFAPHEQASPNMTVRIDAGFLFDGATRTEVAAQSTATITAPASNPRKDLVTIDQATGAVGVVTGTEAASPAAPDCPAGKLPVAIVTLATSTTQITNSLLTDARAVWSAGLGAAAFLALGGAANQIPTNAMLGGMAYRESIDPAAGAFGASDAGKGIVVNAAGKYPVGDGSLITGFILGAALYDSGQLSFTSGTGEVKTLAHSLGREPRLVRVFLECTTADNGYSIGDKLDLTAGQVGQRGLSVQVDSTNVYLILPAAAPQFDVVNRSGFTISNINVSSWRLRALAW